MNALKYRPDIDGLRAIAVLLVVLFHADIKPFVGGFIGVDVFFVISGYLITSLIARDIQAGSFSLMHFWERRIRRILPALATVVFVTTITGLVLFLPMDLVGLGKQVGWQSLTASNFFFWQQVGYFNTRHELKPLLHTWSLAVEEQFYVFFPVLFLLLWRFCKSRFFAALCGIAFLSLGLCIWATSYYPEAAFFLLPFRAWELLAGSLLALNMPVIATMLPRFHKMAGWSGLAMIVGSGVLFTSKIDFPGAAALLPCIGAVLIIWSGANTDGGVQRLLSKKVIVFVGLVSYSWYLWHWPILSFGEYVLQKDFTKMEKIIGVIVSFGLACLSWKYIEIPFRRSGGIFKSRRAVFVAAFITFGAMALMGFAFVKGSGFPQRFSKEAQLYASGFGDRSELRKICNKNQYDRLLQNDVCSTNPEENVKPSFIVWGDSQAEAISPAFITLSKKYHKNGYLALKSGCPPILDIRHSVDDNARPYCSDFNEHHFKFIIKSGIKNVFYIANWTNWVRNKDLYFDNADEWYGSYKERYKNILMAGVQRTVDEMQKNGIRVHFLINMPSMNFEPPRALALASVLGQELPSVDRGPYMRLRELDFKEFIIRNKGENFIFYDTSDILCPIYKCISAHDGHSLYFDAGHLSAYGANYVSPIFEPFFKE